MKKIVYLYGGPGTGKSTTAAHLFALAKQEGINAELVREYIKNWVWEGRTPLPGDQLYIAAKQVRAERICFSDVDLIVSDSPIYLSKYYEMEYSSDLPAVSDAIIAQHEACVKRAGFEIEHVFLQRCKKYNPLGRFHTEAESKKIDQHLQDMLGRLGIEYYTVKANEHAASKILKELLYE